MRILGRVFSSFSTSPTAGHEDELDRAKAELRTAHDSLADSRLKRVWPTSIIYMFITVLVCAEEMFDAHS